MAAGFALTSAASLRYNYDGTDSYRLRGVAVTLDQFKASLTANSAGFGDAVTINYAPGGMSEFNICIDRGTDAPTDLSIDLRGFAPIQNGKVLVLNGNDLLATNSAVTPDKIRPSEHAELSIQSDKVSTQLQPLSWNTLVLGY